MIVIEEDDKWLYDALSNCEKQIEDRLWDLKNI